MLTTIVAHFAIPGKLIKAERFGSGLINDTYLCEFTENNALRKYILQRINTAVFTHPEQVMENVELVTAHIHARLTSEGVKNPDSVTPALIRTRRGQSFHVDASGAYWRMFHFIESGTVFDTVVDTRHAHEIGRGLGRFQALVSDLPPARLHDTLPGFHHTPLYLKELDDAAQTGARERVSEAAPELEFVKARRPLASLLMERMESGELPLRVVHNDPKVNNVMVRTDTREVLCMLDLDTVKPGIVHFDFGDCARSTANPVGEDAEQVADVVFDMPLFEAVSAGYLREAGEFLTRNEVAMLPASVKVITLELGLRFLADHLRGDTYFKIRYPAHNLHRARVQFRLLSSIEAVEGRMESLVAHLYMR